LEDPEHDFLGLARNRIVLIKGKRQLIDSMPEAISQAIALSEVTKSVQFLLHINKTLTQCLVQDRHNSVLPVKRAKMDFLNVDKGWGGQPDCL
jgi:hypothetical protein